MMRHDHPIHVVGGGIALMFFVTTGTSEAFVLASKSSAQKLRKDVDKQNNKHTSCVIKAVLRCEAGGGHSGVECHADTGVVDYAGDPVLDAKSKQPAAFSAALAKCDDKFAPSKKGNDYTGIGCPADCEPEVDGTQRCADMAAYEAVIEGVVGGAVKAQLPIFGAAIDAFCAVDTGDTPASTNPPQIECTANTGDTLARYIKGLGKCNAQCENDYKGKKGGGGDNDDPRCLVGNTGADPLFEACAANALAKAEKKHPLSATNRAVGLPTLHTVLNDASDDMYNRSDPVLEGGNPCGTCGDDARQGAEQCDGTDDAQCVGRCQSDCSCGPIPAEWACNPGFYGVADGCDCGCGAVDPDCVDASAASCEFCTAFGSCSFNASEQCGAIDPTDNASCAIAGWICSLEFYDAADGCDCGCGIIDPDCADATIASCDFFNCAGLLVDSVDPTRCSWTCNPNFYDVADGCDCGCGVVDPDCNDATSSSCEFCPLVGACCADGGIISSDDNAVCVP